MKSLKEIYGDFYSPEHLLSYGRPWMISVGSRSIGKSTGWLIWLIRDYLINGNRFIYLRRTDDEVKATAPTACDSAFMILRDSGYEVYTVIASKHKFTLYRTEEDFKNKVGEEIGCYFALSQSYKYKSANFGANKYNWILYDEFINIDSTKYLGTKSNITYEYDRALELYQTVDRGIGQAFRNETKFIFIANLATYYNPIFIGLGIDEYIRTDSKTIAPKEKLWVVEQTKEVKATEKAKESNSYKLSNDKNKEYAYENTAFDAKMEFVKKVTKPLKPMFNIKFNKSVYGVYYVPSESIIYVSTKRNQLFTIALTVDGQDKIDYTLSIRASDNIEMLQLRNMYYLGKLYCENNHIRYLVANYFMLTPN